MTNALLKNKTYKQSQRKRILYLLIQALIREITVSKKHSIENSKLLLEQLLDNDLFATTQEDLIEVCVEGYIKNS